MDKETDFLGGVAKIALGLFLGGLLLWVAFEYRTRHELSQAARALEEVVARDRTQQEAREAANVERRRRAEDAATIREFRQRQAIREAHKAERAKADAWAKFYQPSVRCLQEASVECGNAHIRARREFERQYDGGQPN